MSLQITQTPSDLNLSQSPIVFVVHENNNTILNNNTFVYVAQIYYWKGLNTNKPSVFQYEISKYKNTAGYGIFEISKLLNSLFTTSLIENESNVYWFSVDFISRYWSGNAWVDSTIVSSSPYKVIDGYKTFDKTEKSNLYPFLIDNPIEHYYVEDEIRYLSVYKGLLNINDTPFDYIYNTPYKVIYAEKITNDFILDETTWLQTSGTTSSQILFNDYASKDTDKQIVQIPATPYTDEFPLNLTHEYGYILQLVSPANVWLGKQLTFLPVCKGRYKNIKIKFKNRVGQFNYFNFNKVSSETFSTENKTFNKQLGSWDNSTFNINSYDSSTKVYASSQKQTLNVNTDFLNEEYNDFFKQLIVSDEIYLIDNRFDINLNEYTEVFIPIILNTNSIQLKTEKFDKLIQYSFSFTYSQPYKMVI